MAKRLTNLRITRVATVDKGANQHAHVLLWKRDDGDGEIEGVEKMPTPDDTHADAFLGAKRKLHGHVKALRNKLKAARKPADVHAAMGGFAAAYGAAMQGVAKALEEAVAKGPGADAYEVARAAVDAQQQLCDVIDDTYEALDTLRRAMDAIQADESITDKAAAIREATQAALASLTAPDPDDDEADPGSVGKGAASRAALSVSGAPREGSGKGSSMTTGQVDHAARVAELEAALEKANREKTEAEAKVAKADPDRIAKMEADLKKAAEEAAEAREIAKAERAAREFVELTKRAEGEFPFAGKPEATAKRLLRIAKIEDEAEREAEMQALKEHNAACKALTTEIGKAGKAPNAGSAFAEAEQRAAELMTKDATGKLSKGTALQRVFRADAELAKRYREEAAQ